MLLTFTSTMEGGSPGALFVDITVKAFTCATALTIAADKGIIYKMDKQDFILT